MNTRGQYGTTIGQQTYVGARLVHTLELKQRYNGVNTGAVQALLNALARNGVARAIETNRWEIALKDGAWVLFTWYPDWSALEITITDRELRGVDQMSRVRRRYEDILSTITPQLQRYGATTVGAAIYAGQQVQQQPRFAARTRAIKAVFDMYTTSHRGARYYIYAEVNGTIDKQASSSLDEANTIFFGLERAPGDVYAAIFDPTDPLWPGPAADVYHEAPRVPQAPQERPAIVGDDAWAGPNYALLDRLSGAWTALYQILASQVGELTFDPSSSSGYRYTTQSEYDANPPDPAKVAWWRSYAHPLITQWAAFQRNPRNPDGSFAADTTIHSWRGQLDYLREEARRRGFKLSKPDRSSGRPPVFPIKPGVLTLGINGSVITVNGRRVTAYQAVEASKAAGTVVEVHLHLADKAVWHALKELLARSGVKWNTVSVVSVGSNRGEYGSAVGLTIYHSVGDRADAVKAMAIDWNALYQNIASQAGVLVADPKASSGYRYLTQAEFSANPPDPKKVLWWKSYAAPLFKEWAKFKIDQLGGDRTVGDAYIAFAERWQTNWDVYEDWKKKLDNLRAEATKRGFNVDTPKPADLPTTVWADVGDVVSRGAGKVASGLGDVWNIVKYGAWAVLGIGAVVAISSVASNLRSGKDPGEKYVEMIRESRRPRSPRALPASRKQQLALPAGEGA